MVRFLLLVAVLVSFAGNALGGSPEFSAKSPSDIAAQAGESAKDVTASALKTASDPYSYYGARYYDPVTSVWQSVDPLFLSQGMFGLNPYHYARLNPLIVVDPDGRRFYDMAHPRSTQNDIEFATGASENEVTAQLALGAVVTTGSIVFFVAVEAGFGIAIAREFGETAVEETTGITLLPGVDDLVKGAAKAVVKEGGERLAKKGAKDALGDAGKTAAKKGGGKIGSGLSKQTRKQLLESRRSYTDLIAEHKKKLADYVADPMAHDNKGTLARASSDAIRQKIIKGRAKVLEGQIRKQEGELAKINKLLGEY